MQLLTKALMQSFSSLIYLKPYAITSFKMQPCYWYIVSQIYDIGSITEKWDIKFCNIIMKYDKTTEVTHICNNQHLCWLTIYHIYFIFYSLIKNINHLPI